MKKIKDKILEIMAFTVIMLFMSSTVFGQVQETQQDTTAQDTTTQMNDQQQTMPQDQNQMTTDDTSSEDPDKGINYSETIEHSELPQEVNTSLDELYPAHEIEEAFRGDDESFKVKVKNETDEAVVYYNEEGKFLRAHNLSGLQQEGALPQEQGQRTMDSENENEFGTDDQLNQQDTDEGEFGTESEDRTGQQGIEQGSQQGQWGSDTEERDNTGTSQQGQWGSEMETDTTSQDTTGTSMSGSSGFPQEQNQRADDELKSKDADEGVNYSESIEESELPQEVTGSLDELYPAHEVEEAFQGDDDSYKVKVKNEDDEAFVYYDSNGDFLRAHNLNGLQQEGTLPQEQGQRTGEQDQWNSDNTGTQDVFDNQQSTTPQDQNQRTDDIDESQDSDRWGTPDRTPAQESNQGSWENDTTGTETQQDEWESESDTLNNEGSAYPQEQNQSLEEGQDDTNWGSDDTGAHQSTWGQDQNQKSEDDEFKSQGERELGNDWGSTDTTQTNEELETTPDDNWGTGDDQMMDQEEDPMMDRQDDNNLEGDDTNTMDGTAVPQEQNLSTGDAGINYSEEVKKKDLPDNVSESIEEMFPEHDIKEAYRGDDGSYKVELKNDDENVAVYFGSDGNFLRNENLDSMLKDDNKDTNQDW